MTGQAPPTLRRSRERPGRRETRVLFPRDGGGVDPYRVEVWSDGAAGWVVESRHPEFNTDGLPTMEDARAFIADTRRRLGAI